MGADSEEGVRDPGVAVSLVDGREDPPLKLVDGPACSKGDRKDGGPRGRGPPPACGGATPVGVGGAGAPAGDAGRWLAADW